MLCTGVLYSVLCILPMGCRLRRMVCAKLLCAVTALSAARYWTVVYRIFNFEERKGEEIAYETLKKENVGEDFYEHHGSFTGARAFRQYCRQ